LAPGSGCSRACIRPASCPLRQRGTQCSRPDVSSRRLDRYSRDSCRARSRHRRPASPPPLPRRSFARTCDGCRCRRCSSSARRVRARFSNPRLTGTIRLERSLGFWTRDRGISLPSTSGRTPTALASSYLRQRNRE